MPFIQRVVAVDVSGDAGACSDFLLCCAAHDIHLCDAAGPKLAAAAYGKRSRRCRRTVRQSRGLAFANEYHDQNLETGGREDNPGQTRGEVRRRDQPWQRTVRMIAEHAAQQPTRRENPIRSTKFPHGKILLSMHDAVAVLIQPATRLEKIRRAPALVVIPATWMRRDCADPQRSPANSFVRFAMQALSASDQTAGR